MPLNLCWATTSFLSFLFLLLFCPFLLASSRPPHPAAPAPVPAIVERLFQQPSHSLMQGTQNAVRQVNFADYQGYSYWQRLTDENARSEVRVFQAVVVSFFLSSLHSLLPSSPAHTACIHAFMHSGIQPSMYLGATSPPSLGLAWPGLAWPGLVRFGGLLN